MSDNNSPYATPNAELGLGQAAEFNDAGIFSFSGRIGRLRYLAYFAALYFIVSIIGGLFGFIIGLSGGEVGEESPVFLVFLALVYLISIAYTFILSRRRLHDLGWTGWWNLLHLIPIVNLIFWLVLIFKRGDETSNEYGNPASPNTLLIKIVGLIFPIVFIIAMLGILAAIAIPAYQDYLTKAQAMQSQQQ